MTECIHGLPPENPCWWLTAQYAVDGIVQELPDWLAADGTHTVVFSAPEDLRVRMPAPEVVALTARANGLSHRKAAALRDVSPSEQEEDLEAAVESLHAATPGDATGKARVLGLIPGCELQGKACPAPNQLYALSVVALHGAVSPLAEQAVAESGCVLPEEAVLRMFDIGAFVVEAAHSVDVAVNAFRTEIAAQEFAKPTGLARHQQLQRLLRFFNQGVLVVEAGQELLELLVTRAPNLNARELIFIADRLQGRTSPEIARWRNVSEMTVERYLSNAFAKMGVSGGMVEAAVVLSGKSVEDWVPPPRLSEREAILLRMLARRENNSAIAEALSIPGSRTSAQRVIAVEKRALFSKLGDARNQVQAVWRALTAEDE